MPLDPKYSNLPYIATDQPDVYEYGDLPESEQQGKLKTSRADQMDASSEIDRPSIDHAAAAGKFRGKQLDSRNADFTDAIRAGRRVGYATSAVELELLDEASRSAETPVQTYSRLQAELAGLAAVVDEAQKSAASGDACGGATPDQLAAMVRAAQEELLALHLDDALGSLGADALEVFDPEGCLEKRLAGELDRLGKQQVTASGQAGGTGTLVYEVYSKPAATAGPAPKDLESRLARLESAVGQAHLKSPALSGDLSGRPLFDAVHRLAGKLSLLEPASLDQLDSRLAALNHRLAQLTSDKREPLADSDTQARVAELYELVKKWDGIADSVPAIVNRLTALKELHEQAMQFSGALNLIDQSQRATSGQVESAGALLKALEGRVAEDLKTVQDNTLAMQERMKALGK